MPQRDPARSPRILNCLFQHPSRAGGILKYLFQHFVHRTRVESICNSRRNVRSSRPHDNLLSIIASAFVGFGRPTGLTALRRAWLQLLGAGGRRTEGSA